MWTASLPPPAPLPVSLPLLSLSRNCKFVCMVVCSAFVSASGLPAQEEKATHTPLRCRRVRLPRGPRPHTAEPRVPMSSHFLLESLWPPPPIAPKGPGWGCRRPASPSKCDLRRVPSLRRGSGPVLPSGSLRPRLKTSPPGETRGRQWPGRGAGGEESDEVSSS